MALLMEQAATLGAPAELDRVVDLLGGYRVLRHRPIQLLDAHDALLDGLPGAALVHLLDSLLVPHDPASIERVIGMSWRTFQRHKGADAKPLSPEQSGRVWKFAEILAKATAVFGSQDEAEQWLERPAIGLDQRRPIDLLATPAGISIVEDFLVRVAYGVYT